MAIRHLVTGGFGNKVFTGSIALAVRYGYTNSTGIGVPPTMPTTAYISILEGTTSVDQYAATSGDALITYTLAGVDESLFTINSNNGILTFTLPPKYFTPLDDDENNIYDVQVVATNSEGNDSQSVFVTVTVDLTAISKCIKDPYQPVGQICTAFARNGK